MQTIQTTKSPAELESLYKQCRRYGKILLDISEDTLTGAWRYLEIAHENIVWDFTLHNGNVIKAE